MDLNGVRPNLSCQSQQIFREGDPHRFILHPHCFIPMWMLLFVSLTIVLTFAVYTIGFENNIRHLWFWILMLVFACAYMSMIVRLIWYFEVLVFINHQIQVIKNEKKKSSLLDSEPWIHRVKQFYLSFIPFKTTNDGNNGVFHVV